MGVQQNEGTAKLILELCGLYSRFWHDPQIVSPSCFSPDIKPKNFPCSNLYPTFQNDIVFSEYLIYTVFVQHTSAPLQGIIKKVCYLLGMPCFFCQVYETQKSSMR